MICKIMIEIQNRETLLITGFQFHFPIMCFNVNLYPPTYFFRT